MAGVSKATVSRALAGDPRISEDTRERILRIAHRHGYVLNEVGRRFRTGRTDTIAVVVPMAHAEQQPLTDPFFSAMLGLLADALARQGYDMLFRRSLILEQDWLQRLAAPHRADGVIVIGQSFAHDRLREAAQAGIPLVVWGEMGDATPGYAGVGSDNAGGGRIAVEHLLSLGRRDILFIGDIRLPEVRARYDGHAAVLREHGIAPSEALRLDTSFDALDLERALHARIAAGVRFDAVFAASDVLAIETIGALLKTGRRIPEDVAVVGFDDMPLASQVHPPLTTLRQDLPTAAARLVEGVLRQTSQPDHTRLMLPVELIVRGSA